MNPGNLGIQLINHRMDFKGQRAMGNADGGCKRLEVLHVCAAKEVDRPVVTGK